MTKPERALRIAQVTGLISLKYGGFERFMVALARACCDRGHRLYYVWEADPTSAAFKADLALAGAESLVMPATGRPARFLAEMALWLHRTGIDVMYGHFNPASLLALAAARVVQVPLPLCFFHSGILPAGQTTLPLKNRLVMRARLSLAARTYAVSAAVRDQIVSLGLGGRTPELFYLGVPRPVVGRSRAEVRREFGLANEDVVVACLAFHDPIKGVDVLLRAMGILARRTARVRLVQVGGSMYPSETQALHELAAEVGVGQAVVWAGQRNDVMDILNGADVYCQPSRSEGLPLAILEAMAVGLPVVASCVGGIPEAVINGQTGILVAKESPGELADALEALASDVALRKSMGEQGRLRALEMFALDNRVRLMLDQCEQMTWIIGR